MDGLHLLVKVIVALVFIHRLLHAPVNALFHLQDVHLAHDEPQEQVHAIGKRRRRQELLLVFKRDRQVTGHRIG